jgi:hypothetical protein
MIEEFRNRYNQSFTEEKYQEFLNTIRSAHGHLPPFRISESPIFIPDALKSKLIEACDDIQKLISRPDFKELTKGAINNASITVPNEDEHTLFLQMDFGITLNEDGELHPYLIELQGFPSLYLFQVELAEAYKKHFDVPSHLTAHLSSLNPGQYIDLLRKMIVGNCDPRNVILLELEPEKQATYIDFLATAHYLGIKILCITDLKKDGKQLFYLDEEGNKIKVERIYNRIIFDELDQRKDLDREFYFKDEVEVDWVGHPAWFFRISKYILPLFDSPYVPKTYYLADLKVYPDDLENYVLKPLYSFAGAGIQLDLDKEMLDNVEDKSNYILQQKVEYAAVIKTPSEPAKCEIRMMMLWEKDEPKGKLVNNLVRLTKGRMVGVKFNKNKDWVGGTVGYFES